MLRNIQDLVLPAIAPKAPAPRAPATKPRGPVIRRPNSGPRFESESSSGPTNPAKSPIAPTVQPRRQLASILPLVPRSLVRADHQQSTLIVRSQEVIGSQKIHPSHVGLLKLIHASQPPTTASIAPTTLCIVPLIA